jgi:hypothetical protein
MYQVAEAVVVLHTTLVKNLAVAMPNQIVTG